MITEAWRETARKIKYGNRNCGLRTNLFERKHRERMGSAIWLFGVLVRLQTTQKGDHGILLRAHHFTYDELAWLMDEKPRTVRHWLDILRRHGYVRVKWTTGKKMILWVLNAKKFVSAQGKLDWQPAGKPSVENLLGQGRTNGEMRTIPSRRTAASMTVRRTPVSVQGKEQGDVIPPRVRAACALAQAAVQIDEAREARERHMAGEAGGLSEAEIAARRAEFRKMVGAQPALRHLLEGLAELRPMPPVNVSAETPMEMSESEYRARYGLEAKA